jgi:hypothetical protein
MRFGLSVTQESSMRTKKISHSVRWWFDDNLEHPTRFTASQRPFYSKKSRAISWFKDTGFDCWRNVGAGEILGCDHGASAWCHRYSWLAVSPSGGAW